MGQASPIWRLPIDTTHHLAGSAGRLCFVGGAGDFDRNGVIRHAGVLPEQIIGAISNLSASLTVESCTLGDVVRLKAFYRSDGSVNEWEVLARIAGELNSYLSDPGTAAAIRRPGDSDSSHCPARLAGG